MSEERFDIGIVGGGLVGASVACALAPLGYSVAVVEAVPRRAERQPSFDERSLALNLASCRILEGLGVWEQMRHAASPIREVIVSELGRPGRVSLKPGELGLETFGHVVVAREIGASLVSRLDELPGVKSYRPATVTGISVAADKTILQLDGEAAPPCVEVSLVVAADGAASGVRRLLGVGVREKDYGQTAVVCNAMPVEPHRGRAYERMTANGPFAILPQRDGRCGLVWCDSAERAEALLDLPEAEFLDRAAHRAGRALGGFSRAGERTAYPLRLSVPDTDVTQRSVFLGNAAHTVHPAGAQGFNLGLRDVAALAEVLYDARRATQWADPGEDHLLRSYSDWRRPDREQTVAWTDGMVTLFTSPYALSRSLRTLGMFAHALVPALRRRLTSQAMGYRERVPRLALGERLEFPDSSAP